MVLSDRECDCVSGEVNNKGILADSREQLIAEIDRRLEDKIIEKSNADLLKKLIENADSLQEAIAIAELGTTYKRTGFHFDKRLEKIEKKGKNIKYFKKNEDLSFSDGKGGVVHKLIIGDNYDALLNLLIEYRGKVDVIYIDPPYGKDSMGQFADTNYDNSLTRDNLLSMLYPRLLLAKQLLSNNGVIFCSIDDKNQAYVKCLFDEVFREHNFSGNIIWQKKNKPSFLSKNFGSIHEYILCYVKNFDDTFPFSLERTEVGKKYPFNNAGNPLSVIKLPANSVDINLPNGVVKAQDMSEGNIITKLLNDVIIKDCKNVNEIILEGEWRCSQKTIDEKIKSNIPIYIAQIPFRPNFIENGGAIKKMKNVLSKTSYNCETNEDGEKQFGEILPDAKFDNPKPSGLIKLLLQACTYDNKKAVVLDFFAGSCTTGQAVLELNKEDGGNRQAILCTLNEITDVNPNGIAYDVTTKRLKRVMTGCCYDGSTDFEWIKKNEAYGGNLDVYEIESVSNSENTTGKTAFDVIDETLYGKEKFKTLKEKIEWVCTNFDGTQKMLVQRSEVK